MEIEPVANPWGTWLPAPPPPHPTHQGLVKHLLPIFWVADCPITVTCAGALWWGNGVIIMIRGRLWCLVLSFERPILGDNPKAHAWKPHQNCHFSHEKQWFSLGNLINQLIQHKSFSFHGVLGEGYVSEFHENRTKDHQLPEMGNPNVSEIVGYYKNLRSRWVQSSVFKRWTLCAIVRICIYVFPTRPNFEIRNLLKSNKQNRFNYTHHFI